MLKTVLILLSLVVVTHSSSITYDSINRTTVTLVAGAPEGGYAEGPFDQALFWQPQGGSMIAGSGIAVVADTANQVIRGVDFASRRAFHIAGNPTVLGNCLDETCPLDSFVDGFGNASTLTMPYSVSLHPYQRHAFIADTRSRAIRKLDLHTGEVHTCMEGLGFPTDVVLWDDWLAFSDGLNHSIWVYRGVDLGSGVGDPPWAGGATLLSGANDWSAEGQYVEGSASSARFWEPLGLTYNPGEGKIYVADYRNRVIREVHPVTGFTARRVGRNDLPASSVSDGDDAMASVVLAGPTNLVYHGDADAVYFSDRNPEEDMGSIRVWYVGTGVVRTLVGQLTRRAGDGLVTSGLVGASAAWGVFLMPGGWVGWTETDTNSIRAVVSVCVPPVPGFTNVCTSCPWLHGASGSMVPLDPWCLWLHGVTMVHHGFTRDVCTPCPWLQSCLHAAPI